MDLSGKLIIKARLGDDIRLTPIHNEDITYDELVLMMQRVFKGKIDTSDELLIKYKDEDGDLITIFDSSDLSFAIQYSRLLNITILVNAKPRPLESDQVKYLKTELRDLRNRVTQILDHLDAMTPVYHHENNDQEMASLNQQMEGKLQIAPGGGKEFDPLSSQRGAEDASKRQVMSSFGLQNDASSEVVCEVPPPKLRLVTRSMEKTGSMPSVPDLKSACSAAILKAASSPSGANHQRSGSPDSISSIGSSNSQRQHKTHSPFPSQQQQQQQQQQQPNPQGFPPQNPQQQQQQQQQQYPGQQPAAPPQPTATPQQSDQDLSQQQQQQQHQNVYQPHQQGQYPAQMGQYGQQQQQQPGAPPAGYPPRPGAGAPGQYAGAPQQQQQYPTQPIQQPYNPQGMPPGPPNPQQYPQAYNQQGGPGAPGQPNPYSQTRYPTAGYGAARPPAGVYQQGYQ